MKNWERLKFDSQFKKLQLKRILILEMIRTFFKKQGFLEFRTPLLVKYAGQEPYLSPIKVAFEDERSRRYEGYLITSPEYSLKKILAAGFDKIFEITSAFRQNESFGGLHNPEFLILEWYRRNSHYRELMKDVEKMIFYLNWRLKRSRYLIYQEQKIDLAPPWPKITVKEAFKKWAGINLDKARDLKSFKNQVRKAGLSFKYNNWDDLFYEVFLNKIEPRLKINRPIIIYDYPLPQAALARRKNAKSFYAERFELFIGGLELANAFSELSDPEEQLKRFKAEQKIRKKLKKPIIPIDNDFLKALKWGLGHSSGIALGIDRLEMLLLNIKDINDLLIFPARDLFAD